MKGFFFLLGALIAALGTWVMIMWRRASTFFPRIGEPDFREPPAIREAEKRRLEEKIERVRATREKTIEEIRCMAKSARERITKKFNR